MATSVRFAFPLQYTRNMDATKRFFTDVLGLQLDRDHPTFVQLRDASGANYALATDEPLVPTTGAELWWVVDNAEQACAEMSKKAELVVPLTQMPFGTCFGLKDPSGQVHYLLQFAQQRPSQQV
jgi:catechol 2,3-dioxygenase-like lactoylglutathione lyase family enzyme